MKRLILIAIITIATSNSGGCYCVDLVDDFDSSLADDYWIDSGVDTESDTDTGLPDLCPYNCLSQEQCCDLGGTFIAGLVCTNLNLSCCQMPDKGN